VNNKIKLGILAFIYIFYIIRLYNDALIWHETIALRQFLNMGLFNTQHLFFPTTIFFVLFLYFLKKPLLASMSIIRWKGRSLKFFALYVIKRSLLFTIFIILTHVGVATILGSPFILDGSALDFILLFITITAMFTVYLAILFKTKQQILSILSVMIFNIVLSAINIAIYWGASFDLEPYIFPLYYTIGILCIIYISIKCKLGEFL